MFEPLETRLVLDAGPLLISEFMADNETTLADGDRDYPDWIEICNPTDGAVDLTRWYLTDDDNDLAKWQFPAASLGAGEYLVVFASGKHPDGPPGELHTNFQLDAAGEYLALVREDGVTISYEVAPEYPRQLPDVSYGLTEMDAVLEDLITFGAGLTYHLPTPGDDPSAWTETDFDDSGWVDAHTVGGAGLVISEIETGPTNWIEIQNVSDAAINTAGWAVAVNDGASGDIRVVNDTVWNLPDSIAAGDVLYRTDEPADQYWGRDIAWDAGGPGWAMILDDAGRLVDFLAWGYDEAEIASLRVSAGGFDNLAVGEQWLGNGAQVGDGIGGGDPLPEEDFVTFGATWDYLHPLDATDPADSDPDFDATWMQLAGYDGPAFDGSGQGMLGFGPIDYGPVVTQIGTPDSGSRYTAYFRREFTLTDDLVDVGIEILSDDGAVIYIDGDEVTRNNITAADGYFAVADSARYPDGATTESRTETLSIADLAAGTYTIGVSVHQNQAGSSDMAFDLRLFGRPDAPLGSALRRIGDGDWNTAADFLPTRQPTKETQNPDLTVPFGQVVPATTGIGYSNNRPEFESLIRTDVGETMQGVNASLWTRIEFEISDLPPVDVLTLRMKYDDGFVAYLNGVEVARRNAPDLLAHDSTAEASHPNDRAVVFEAIDISGYMVSTLQVGANVLAIHGLNQSAGDDDFLIVPELVATGSMADPLYMTSPSPRRENSSGSLGLVADTQFSIDRGFYSEPFEVEVHSDTPGAEIRYTLNGSKPTATTGTVYAGPIQVTKTTTLRAAAFKPGYIPTNIDTQTYIFPDQVLRQTGAGFPVGWGEGGRSDYGIDPEIVNDPQYRDQFIDGLTDIPTLSLVLPVQDIFATGTGLYDNPLGTTEKATSAEWIYADGREGFQVDAGLRMQGGASRNTNKAPKHSMSLRFRQTYGPGRLDFPLFEDGEVNRFNSLHLRAMFNNSWIHWNSGQRSRGSMIRDQWARDSLLEMGQTDAGEGTYAHLYINGLYWGVYNVHERQEASHYAEHNGGDEDLIDALNTKDNVVDGNKSAWTRLQSMVRDAAGGGISPAEFEQIREKLDVISLIDYMIVNHYGANQDWDGHNWRAAGGGPEDVPWKIYSWDAERILEGVTANRTTLNNAECPSALFQNLRNSEEFKLLFADRLHKHFYNGGAMTPQRTAARWMDRAEELKLAIVGESARWGDYRRDVHSYSGGPYELYTKNDHWLPEQRRLIRYYFPDRSDVLLVGQYGSMDLYPDTDAPVFYVNDANRHGGAVLSTDAFTLPANRGTVYYTLDGSDPRLPGGAVNTASALVFDGTPIFLTESGMVRARAKIGSEWSALNEAEFFVDSQAGADNLAITEINYNPYAPTPDELAGYPERNNDDFEFVELCNISDEPIDLSGVRFTDGIEFDFADADVTMLGPGEYAVVVKDTAAFQSRYATGVPIAGVIADGSLSNGGEQLELIDYQGETIQLFSYRDSGAWPGRADGKGASLEVLDVAGDYNDATNWRSSGEYGGSPDFAGTGPRTDVVVNEVLTHTDSPYVDTIELYNTSGTAVNIGGWYLSDDSENYLKFRIPPGTTIAAGGYLVFDEEDFNPGQDTRPTDFALNGAHGDDVWLMEADAADTLVRFADHAKFGAAADGESWGRWPTSAGEFHFYPMIAPTVDKDDPQNGANSGPRIGSVIVSELQYNPGPGDENKDLEFIEILNGGGQVELADWRIRGGIDFDFPGMTLDAYATLIVVPFDPAEADKLANFHDAYWPGGDVPEDLVILGPYDGQLADNGEAVRLQSPDRPPDDEPNFIPRLLEDEVSYDDADPWPAGADGTGQSLTRRGIDLWGDEPESWIAAEPTPGMGILYPGDANLDGVTDVRDFNIWNAHKFTAGTVWSQGDFNGDRITDVRDFNIWNAHKFTSAIAPAPVHDAALEEDWGGGSDSLGVPLEGLAWLHELSTGRSRPAEEQKPGERAVDALLATFWP